MENIKDEKALFYALEIAIKRHDEELKRTENFVNRANNLIGYAAALGTVYFGIVTKNAVVNLYHIFWVFIIELAVIILCLWSNNTLLQKKFSTGPGGSILKEAAKKRSEVELKWKILESYTSAYDRAYDNNKFSSKLLRWASLIFAMGFVIGFLQIFYINKFLW